MTEIERLRAAVKIAREQGEHSPVCGMPPREIMNDRERYAAWRTAKHEARSTSEGRALWDRQHCACWKARVEALLDWTPFERELLEAAKTLLPKSGEEQALRGPRPGEVELVDRVLAASAAEPTNLIPEPEEGCTCDGPLGSNRACPFHHPPVVEVQPSPLLPYSSESSVDVVAKAAERLSRRDPTG